ncbi:MAG: DMT family transporter [Candidatus Zixiibacteriota bacterium]
MTNTHSGSPTFRRHSLAIIIPVLLFQQTLGGITFPVAKFGLEQIEPFTFAFFRFVISVLILFVLARRSRGNLPIARSDLWKIIGLGLLIVPGNQVLYLAGQNLTGVGHGSLLFATTPVFILMAAVIHLKEKLLWRRVAGTAIALAGVATIMITGAIEISIDYLWGDLLILVAVIAWAYYTVLGKPLVEKYGAMRVTAYALGSGTLFYFPFGLFRALASDYSAVTWQAWGSVLYLAIGTSVGAYVLWYWVLRQMDATRIAVYHNLQPVVAVSIAHIWMGETLGVSFVVGGLIVLGGLILAEL